MSTTPSPPFKSILSNLLEELLLIRSSLLPNETLLFDDDSIDEVEWDALLDAHAAGDGLDVALAVAPPSPPEVILSANKSNVSFRVIPCSQYPEVREFSVEPTGGIGRDEAETWRRRIGVVREAIDPDAQYPMYEMLSLSLLPMLQEDLARGRGSTAPVPSSTSRSARPTPYHALFTSHHLIAASKRRALNAWSAELGISGFAKLGYPGVIYSYGAEDDVNEFVRRVKALNWLALRLRVLEPLEGVQRDDASARASWCEYEKVSEVVSAMKGLGRERLVLAAGIGASSNER